MFYLAHKNNKNSKSNKKASKKAKDELNKMKFETANDVGYSNASKKLGNSEPREREIRDPRS